MLAEYSFLFDERLNNWIEYRGDLIEMWLYDKKADCIRYCYLNKVDYDLIKDYYWRIEYGDNRLYVITSGGSKKDKHPDIRMHRLIMNTPENLVVDHKDGNGLNNIRKNMRNVTEIDNSRNRKANENNTTGFKNVRDCNPNRNGYEVNLRDKYGKKYSKYFAISNYKNSDEALLAAAIHAEEKQIEFDYLHARYEQEQKLYNTLYNLINKKR